MKQLILNLKNGQTDLLEAPDPIAQPGELLIRTICSLLSPGTEQMLVNFGKAGWLAKARQQPERVSQVLQKIKTDGLQATYQSVRQKLDQPVPLGYCNVGRVISVGIGVKGFAAGDRVVSNGPHASVVAVPEHLAAKIPDEVQDEAAAFTVVGAIALQSIRLLQPTFGETILVIGLGLIGQLTAQLLRASGCKVIATDLHSERTKLASDLGAATIEESGLQNYVSDCYPAGIDGVIITANAKDDNIVSTAANACRKRGRIVLSGVVDLNINRADFYQKELSFQVSASYGPGRYETAYENKGLDYPIAFVRWTAQRNFEAVLAALASKQLQVIPLVSKEIDFEEAATLYESRQTTADITTLIRYQANGAASRRVVYREGKPATSGIGLIGAGAFANAVLLPLLKKFDTPLWLVCSAGGLSAGLAAKKFGIQEATSEAAQVINDEAIGSVIIATRHKEHASLAASALKAGKHVFVEKPLALTVAELDAVISAKQARPDALLHVGFNRRFAPLAAKARNMLQAALPINIIVTMNAGFIPADHWTQDPETGGGRIIGEACHLIDLCAFFAQAEIKSVFARAMQDQSGDNASILLSFSNGSNAVVNYFANGSKRYDKERVEIYQSGRTLVIENWRKLSGYGFQGFSTQNVAQDKGHSAQLKQWLAAIKNGVPLIPFESLINVSEATLAAAESIRSGKPVMCRL